MTICYLSSQNTLPGSPKRRSDAFEHDQMMNCLRPALAAHGLTLEAAAWDDPDKDWSHYDLVVIGTAWDYWDQLEKFLATLEQIALAAPIFNQPALVRWNLHKQYLRELTAKNIPTIPTHWVDQVTPTVIDKAKIAFKSDDLVLKRQVGAGADGQHRLRGEDPFPALRHPMMIQPFMPAIKDVGEVSVVIIDGKVSHALLKTAASDDYRIQSSYGGREAPYRVTDSLKAFAGRVIDALPDAPLYARVDVIPDADKGWLLMEVELVEPFLYPKQGPALGALMAEAIAKRL